MSSTIQYGFGSGTLFGFRTDVSNPTPVQFGALQDVSLDVTFNMKELYGQYQFPLAVARSVAKVQGKAKVAKIDGRMFNDLFFGQTLATTNRQETALNEGPTAIPATPFQITVANGATFKDDLGVINSATSARFTRVSASPAAGQYSVNTTTGVYTFASADNVSAISVQISYTYGVASGGNNIVVGNQLLGAAPQFQVNLYESYQSNTLNVKLHACISTKLMLPTKLEDFLYPEIDFSAFTDASNNIMTVSISVAS